MDFTHQKTFVITGENDVLNMYSSDIPYAAHSLTPELTIRDYNAGYDMFIPDNCTVAPHACMKINLKIRCKHVIRTDNGFVNCEYQLHPRSSIANTPLIGNIGIIDAGYNGYLHAVVRNLSDEPYTIQAGTRLFQLVSPIVGPNSIVKVDESSELFQPMIRGDGRFGSTN